MMPRTLKELEAEFLSLPVEARGRLTRRLLDSLKRSDAEIQPLFERRAEKSTSGRAYGKLARSEHRGPLTERGGLLLVSAPLEGPWIDHRTIREEYLDETLDPQG